MAFIRNPLSPRLSSASGWALALATAALVSCGGGGDDPAPASAAPSQDSSKLATTSSPTARTATIAEAELTSASATPCEMSARTIAGLYLSGKQAEDLAVRLREEVVWVMVPCCGSAHQDLAILIAYGMQAAQNLPKDAPFLVRGRNLAEAAAVADRLTRSGLSRVVLVTS